MFIYNILFCAAMAYALGWVYHRFGNSLNNKKAFAKNFVLISTTTMLVIVFVKSSLALSLGLVGALSIIRFRAAIKEPEELAFLFLSIVIGLGCGAGYSSLTFIGFIVLMALVILLNINKKSLDRSLFITVYLSVKGDANAMRIEDIISKRTAECHLRRYDETEQEIEASFSLVLSKTSDLDHISADLRALNSTAKISYFDATNKVY